MCTGRREEGRAHGCVLRVFGSGCMRGRSSTVEGVGCPGCAERLTEVVGEEVLRGQLRRGRNGTRSVYYRGEAPVCTTRASACAIALAGVQLSRPAHFSADH